MVLVAEKMSVQKEETTIGDAEYHSLKNQHKPKPSILGKPSHALSMNLIIMGTHPHLKFLSFSSAFRCNEDAWQTAGGHFESYRSLYLSYSINEAEISGLLRRPDTSPEQIRS